MARVLTADELQKMTYGHGWAEYKPDEEDGPEIPWQDYLMETVWIRKIQLMRDYQGSYNTGSIVPNDDYGVDWRIWDEEPTEELAKQTPWEERHE